jgi:hypothetical protein
MGIDLTNFAIPVNIFNALIMQTISTYRNVFNMTPTQMRDSLINVIN